MVWYNIDMFYEVIPAKGGVRDRLTYFYDRDSLSDDLAPEELQVGQIVAVPLMRGVVP